MKLLKPRIRPLIQDGAEPYDLFIATVGYEQRARYVAEKQNPTLFDDGNWFHDGVHLQL